MPDPSRLASALSPFSFEARRALEAALEERAVVPAQLTRWLLSHEALDTEQLLTRLLPVAMAYAEAPTSGFRVGAIAACRQGGSSHDLHLGANWEPPRGPLSFSVHAEQAAVVSAWVNNQTEIELLAVSAMPCGYCRQFLQELGSSPSLFIAPREATAEPPLRSRLEELLPHPFGPRALGVSAALLSSPRTPLVSPPGAEPLLAAGIAAAERSHAPYSGALAAVALEAEDGAIVAAPYAESAAHNPSLAPLSAALVALVTQRAPSAPRKIRRALLVEAQGKLSQRELTAAMLTNEAPNLTLEYHAAQRLEG
ncbi:MAG: cytidine deaminase [Polyangiaceae bacterium]|nr:cytidine deaminase [Polyangiaceae bacterium]MCW5789446.1 cytidine deaminase [Polyangiaceae bacterium]